MAHQIKTILSDVAFGEGPRWHDGKLFFSDMHAHQIVTLSPDGTKSVYAQFNAPVSGLGWLPDGRLLVVSMEDRKVLRQEKDGSFVTHADLSGIATWHCNDMTVTKDGIAFVGNFGFSLHPPSEPKAAKLARITPDGQVSVVAEDLMFPNGMVITADDKTLIVGESFSGRFTAFDLAKDGTLSNRRIWAELPKGGVPDGCCLDAEGAIWVASPTTSTVIRIHEGGKISETIKTEQQAIACMLGGADRKTLYILTAASTDPEVCAKVRTARVEAVQVDVPGAGLP